ncbi:transmembrane protein 254 isoform X2 [Myotis myotis]|uniref:transmembrane protein 254 isoform X2 n=1 Tax=Myotis myotis TaxID=51298 RepID=UPI00174CAE43|nr:transmembrane protein 254 isoform X2 [Myotis myotis]
MGKAAGDEAYFQRGSLFWFTVITLSFGYYTWAVFWPQSIPYQSLGPLGPFTQYLVDHHHALLRNGFHPQITITLNLADFCSRYWLAWLIHVGESLYAMVLCKSKGITNGQAQLLWFLQTFLFGIASLSILIAYRPKRQKQT